MEDARKGWQIYNDTCDTFGVLRQLTFLSSTLVICIFKTNSYRGESANLVHRKLRLFETLTHV